MNTYKLVHRVHRGISIAAILALGTIAASAHPGHSLTDATPAHLLTSPDHLVALAVAGAGLLLGALFMKRLVARRAMQVTGGVAIAAAAVTAATQFLG